MKKMLAMGLACAIVLAPAISVHAAEVETCSIGGCNLGECFMDRICDFHSYVDVNADGICDFYVDADEDGICDHCHDHGKPVPAETYLEGATAPVVTYTAPAPAVTYTAPAPSYTAPATSYDYYGCYGSRHHRSGGHHGGHCW